jgi:hypothetical protein
MPEATESALDVGMRWKLGAPHGGFFSSVAKHGFTCAARVHGRLLIYPTITPRYDAH